MQSAQADAFSTSQNDMLLSSLISRAAVATVQVSTLEWVPNAFTGRSFVWYLSRVYSEIERLFLTHGPVSLVAHSQGGILALICLGSHRYDGIVFDAADMASSLVTLGTGFISAEAYPFKELMGFREHRVGEEPLPVGVKPEVAEHVSRSSLAFTNFYYPDSASLPGICTTCVAGRCEMNMPSSGWLQAARYWGYDLYSKVSYKVYLDRMSETAGDGVTPLCLATWPKAEAVILGGVRHMNIFPFYGEQWYGSPEVVGTWDSYLS